ncbi:MAG: hypothetical protein PHQ27_01860 [Victivallales bacterium]|nr:hypothetical protein [Victivallales bacterium]
MRKATVIFASETGQVIVELVIGLFFISLFLMIGLYVAGFSMVNVSNLISARSEAENNSWANNGSLSVTVDSVFADKLSAIDTAMHPIPRRHSGDIELEMGRGDGQIDDHYDEVLSLGRMAPWFGMEDQSVSDLVKKQKNRIYFPLLNNDDE